MKHLRVVLAAPSLCTGGMHSALALAPAAASAPAKGLPAVELFFRCPDMPSAKLSPSGRWLAVNVKAADGRFALGMVDVDVDGATPPAVVAHFRDRDVDDWYWVGDSKRVFDRKQWGRAVQDVLADAVARAAGKGIIDPN